MRVDSAKRSCDPKIGGDAKGGSWRGKGEGRDGAREIKRLGSIRATRISGPPPTWCVSLYNEDVDRWGMRFCPDSTMIIFHFSQIKGLVGAIISPIPHFHLSWVHPFDFPLPALVRFQMSQMNKTRTAMATAVTRVGGAPVGGLDSNWKTRNRPGSPMLLLSGFWSLPLPSTGSRAWSISE